MNEIWKRIKPDVILSALVCAVIGVVLLLWPAETIDVFCRILAAGLIVMGGVNIVSYLSNRSMHPFAGVVGLIVVLVGIWIFIRPESIVSLVPIVIGVILCAHGISDLQIALETKANGYERWWSILVVAAVAIGFGILCIVNAFGMVKLALQFIGIALIYDGISALWIVSRAVQSARERKREEDVLDVEYKEVDKE